MVRGRKTLMVPGPAVLRESMRRAFPVWNDETVFTQSNRRQFQEPVNLVKLLPSRTLPVGLLVKQSGNVSLRLITAGNNTAPYISPSQTSNSIVRSENEKGYAKKLKEYNYNISVFSNQEYI